MKKLHRNLLIVGLLVLSACQSRGNNVEGLDSIVNQPEANFGVIVFGYTVENANCEAKVYVESTDYSTTTKEEIWSGIGATLSPRKYMLAKLPKGNYKISSIDCPGVYKIGGARFSRKV